MVFGLSIWDVLLLLYGLLVAFVILASSFLFMGFHRLPDGPSEEEPLVSIILPVRNQADTVERCLRSLLDSDYSNREIIVVEGGSDDGTRVILEPYADRLRLLKEKTLRKGWVGKNWACHQGYQAAKGDLLLFTDGDTLHAPGLLRRAVSHLSKEDIGLLTLASRLRVVTFWERVIQPLMIFLIGLTHRGRWVNRSDKPWAMGNGQFMLFRRDVYEAVGGHSAVRDRVDEDYRLACLTKERGFPTYLADGRDGLEVRMYSSLREIWHGWVKNAFPGMDFSLYKIVRGVVGLFLLMVLPFVLLAWGLFQLTTGGPTLLLWVSASLGGLIWIRLALAHALFGGGAGYALMTPIGAVTIAIILLDSARRYLRGGGVAWKGRVYGIPEK